MRGIRLTHLPTGLHSLRQVTSWYAKAHIDYADHFLKLYIAYNAWYREAVGTTNDRQALTLLKKRYIIWEEYYAGKTMPILKLYMERLVDLTQKEPLTPRGAIWNGEVGDINDWPSLIEYWYQVRCLVVHGSPIKQKYVWLAYETLNVFMGEIIGRAERYRIPIEQVDMKRAETLG